MNKRIGIAILALVLIGLAVVFHRTFQQAAEPTPEQPIRAEVYRDENGMRMWRTR